MAKGTRTWDDFVKTMGLNLWAEQLTKPARRLQTRAQSLRGCTPCLWAGTQRLKAISSWRVCQPRGGVGAAEEMPSGLFPSFLLLVAFCPQVPQAVRLINQINQRRAGALMNFLTLSGKQFLGTDTHSPSVCGRGGLRAWNVRSSLPACGHQGH